MNTLETKFYVPRIRQSIVPRQRLFDLLDQSIAQERNLILVSASAGSGKSTLLSSWIAHQKNQILLRWISLDENDNSPQQFWKNIFASLEEVVPSIHSDFQQVIGATRGTDLDIRGFINELINELSSLPNQTPIFIILDDFHLIQSIEISEMLAYFLEFIPTHVHLVLASRADPIFPLSRFRLNRRLLEIREADLRFNLDEVGRYYTEVMRLSLTEEQCQTLVDRTEGWIAGLQLAGLSMADQADIDEFLQYFSGDNRYIADYLVEEAINKLDPEMRDFLYRTSILRRFNAAVCAALTGCAESQAQEFFLQMERQNLLLVNLDDRRNWYRYHHLFSELLKLELELHYPDEIHGLHARASKWYAKQGMMHASSDHWTVEHWYEEQEMLNEAIQHAIAGGDQQYCIELIESNLLRIVFRLQFENARRWLEMIGAPAVAGNLWLSIGAGWVAIAEKRYDEVQRHLENALRVIRMRGEAEASLPERTRGHLKALEFLAQYGLGASPKACMIAEDALRMIPNKEVEARLWVLLPLADCYSWCGKMDDSERCAQAALDLGITYNLSSESIAAYLVFGHTAFARGKFQLELDYYKKALAMDPRISSKGEYSPISWMTFVWLSSNYRWAHQLERAYDAIHQGLKLAERWHVTENLSEGYMELAEVYCAMGNYSKAVQASEVAFNMAKEHSAWMTERVYAHSLNILSVQGMYEDPRALDEPLAWMDKWLAEHPDEPVNSANKVAYVMLAKLLVITDRMEEALAIIEEIERMDRASGFVSFLIQVLALKAIAQDALGQTEAAFLTLDEVLLSAVHEDCVEPFLNAGPKLRSLLWKYRDRDSSEHYSARVYAARLLKLFDEKQNPYLIADDRLIEELTDREREVMELIALGLSNQDIADKLVLAESTVKKHVSNIFGKLGVRKRTQAVARAQELKLI